jgi:alkanesulfonate monooxygenase SsuD/methylene tetrahydromethanopterin reductase-like flavin-dependent oxidoreductase (luciferase family)
MKFSLFYEIQLADSFLDSESALFLNCLEQAVLADQLGYHCVWEVEHHGLYQYSHSSAPEIFLSFVAARTSRIRVGHGCVLLPYRYNHPIRVAERIATLDILSNGRVSWGGAKSVTRVEREAFEVDSATIHQQWLEAMEMIPNMWNSGAYSYRGHFFNIPPIYVLPKPIQKPHPPMFGACTRPEQAVSVGAMGLGALNLGIYHEERLAEKVHAYREAIAHSAPVGRGVNNHFACTAASCVLKDDYTACRHGLRGSSYFTRAMMHYSQGRPIGNINVKRDFPPDEHVRHFRNSRNTPYAQLSSVIGDPEAARESVKRFADVGIDELILVMQNGTTPHEITMQSIRTFAEEVMPFFV